MRKKTPLSLFFYFSMGVVCLAQQNSCDNIGFESGNFTGWRLEYGRVSNVTNSTVVVYSTPILGTFNRGHMIMSTANGNDPNITVENIPVVAVGSNFSARIGNSASGSYYDRISRTILVTEDNSLFLYKFAIVLQNPDPRTHTRYEQPKFILKVVDPNGNSDDCNTYEVYASVNNKGFKSQGTGTNLLVYRNWTTAALDLRAFLGQTITIAVTATDCTEGGHYGYAYFDAQCLSSKITANQTCDASADITLSAPAGFETYSWSTGDTTNTLIIHNPVAGTRYTVKLKPFFSISDSCQLTVDYTIPNFRSDTVTVNQMTCQPSDTGTVVRRLMNRGGCDSIVTIKTNLLRGRDTLTLNFTSCNPSDTGIVIRRFTNFVGCDSFVRQNTILLRGRDTLALNFTSCNPIDTGVVIRRFTNFVGCDSFVRQKTILLRGRDTLTLSLTSCNPSDTGVIVRRFTNFVGCDSFVRRKTNLLRGRDTTFLNLFTCNAKDSGLIIQKLINSNGCDSFLSIRKQFDALSIEATTEPTDCSGETGVLTVIKTIGGKPPYQYALQDSFTYQISPIFRNLNSNSYSVFVKDSLKCTQRLDKVQVKRAQCKVFIPNAFSPNNDGQNDKFVVFASPQYIKTIKNYRIFNRWGDMVYEAPNKDVPFNQFSDWWDGTFRTQSLPPDVFIYVIEVEYFDVTNTSGEPILKGDVTLMH